MLPPIKGFIGASLIEWEGKIVAVLFLPTCNLRCKYCHSADLVLHAEELESIPWEKVRDTLQHRREWLDGVEVTGGEPTLHQELPELLKALKDLNLAVKLDTNGTRPRVLKELTRANLVDYVAMDVKAPLDDRYHRLADVTCDLDAIRQSIQFLKSSSLDYEFRTTVCPAFIDKCEVLAIARELEGARRWVLQPFRPQGCLDPGMLSLTPYSPEKLGELAALAAPYVEECRVRGEAPLKDIS